MPGQDAPGLGSRSKAPEGNTWMHPPSIRTANTTLYQSVSALSTYVRVCGRAHCSAHAALGASRVLLRYNTLRLRPRRQPRAPRGAGKHAWRATEWWPGTPLRC